MKITVVGTGFVGLSTALALAEHGHRVTCVDRKPAKVAQLNAGRPHIFEPGMAEALKRALAKKRLSFTTDLPSAVGPAKVVFITVGTPSAPDGSADLSQVHTAARQIARAVKYRTVVTLKSTVPVGTTEAVAQIIHRATRKPIDTAFNPEFLREGAALADARHPNRVVVGTSSDYAKKVLGDLFARTVPSGRLLMMSTRSAELTKYAANGFLATKISYMNELARYAEIIGADIVQVRRGIGLDPRIGESFLGAGIGYGGSCFPKDVSALLYASDKDGVPLSILSAVQKVNAGQTQVAIDYLLKHLHKTNRPNSLRGVKVAVWGLAFKPRTDDLRQAPSRSLIATLYRLGAKILAFDPKAMQNAAATYPWPIEYTKDSYQAVRGVSAIILATEWSVFLRADWRRVKRLAKKNALVIDGRNSLPAQKIRAAGLAYQGFGRVL